MAGCFYHLWLAHQVCQTAGLPVAERHALLAGGLAPDLGFFPGGPVAFSERVHHERSGDFLRALAAAAEGPQEDALVAGWALHLWTDQVLHPLVDAWVGERQGGRWRGQHAAELWHRRLEWGLDCILLERPELRPLWGATLCFPTRPDGASLVFLVGSRCCPEPGLDRAVRRGTRSTERWIRRLPALFLWTGRVAPTGRSRALGRAVRPLADLIGQALAPFPRWIDAAAVARPAPLEAVEAERALGQADEVLRRYRAGQADGHAGLSNASASGGAAA